MDPTGLAVTTVPIFPVPHIRVLVLRAAGRRRSKRSAAKLKPPLPRASPSRPSSAFARTPPTQPSQPPPMSPASLPPRPSHPQRKPSWAAGIIPAFLLAGTRRHARKNAGTDGCKKQAHRKDAAAPYRRASRPHKYAAGEQGTERELQGGREEEAAGAPVVQDMMDVDPCAEMDAEAFPLAPAPVSNPSNLPPAQTDPIPAPPPFFFDFAVTHSTFDFRLPPPPPHDSARKAGACARPAAPGPAFTTHSHAAPACTTAPAPSPTPTPVPQPAPTPTDSSPIPTAPPVPADAAPAPRTRRPTALDVLDAYAAADAAAARFLAGVLRALRADHADARAGPLGNSGRAAPAPVSAFAPPLSPSPLCSRPAARAAQPASRTRSLLERISPPVAAAAATPAAGAGKTNRRRRRAQKRDGGAQ